MVKNAKKFSYDFHGWATRPDVKCTDGVTIKQGAFSDCDGHIVPMVWNHQHNSPDNVLGRALLVQRDGGMYAYGSFNDSPMGQNAKILVEHGDIEALSIFANGVRRSGDDVVHGTIREVSLVIAGANPMAKIMEVMAHGEDSLPSSEFFGIGPAELTVQHGEIEIDADISHADDPGNPEEPDDKKGEKTIGEIVNSMNEAQQTVFFGLLGKALDGEDPDENEGGNNNMKQNAFDKDNPELEQDGILSQSAIDTIIGDAKRCGSMRESVLQHAQEYGIQQIDYLFPEAKANTTTPEFIKRDTGWVSKVMGSIHRTPFSRIKSVFADITEDDARAKGYMKGNMKKDEVFSLLKRVTTPTTIYKKQKMDRDDVIDITDFDVIGWIKAEMRLMLDEEIARAILIGDGRLGSSDDKINEQCIRPVMKDEDLYAIKVQVTVKSADDGDTRAKAFIRSAIKARKDYKGSGQPTLYTTEDMLTDMLLLEDTLGHALYADEAALARKLRVKEIVTVPVMEGVNGPKGGKLYGIIVNLTDYTVGADKGGAINMFEDFDIDYNQQKYLIETRCSGALTKPFSAIVIEENISG